jgi:hypothetical protein
VNREPDLGLRREQLLMRSAELRLTMAEHGKALEKPLAVVDTTRDALRWLRDNPEWPLGALALVVLMRPKRALVWAARAWWGWGMYRRFDHLMNTAPLSGKLGGKRRR